MKKNKRVASEYFFGLLNQTWKIGSLYFFRKIKITFVLESQKELINRFINNSFEKKNIKLTIFLSKKELLKWIRQFDNPSFST